MKDSTLEASVARDVRASQGVAASVPSEGRCRRRRRRGEKAERRNVADEASCESRNQRKTCIERKFTERVYQNMIAKVSINIQYRHISFREISWYIFNMFSWH